jgi:hypothetical protein
VNHHIRKHATIRSPPITAWSGKAKAFNVQPVPVVVHIDMPSREFGGEEGGKFVGNVRFCYVSYE